jgi:glycosyltransferase involved in cell wall biosynthesis
VNPLVSIVLPVKNQAAHITQVVTEYHAALNLAQVSFEILLVVNDSSDRSPECCDALARAIPGVRCFVIDRPGWGCAVRAGLGRANGELLCYTNSARTRSDELALLVVKALSCPDRVFKAQRRQHQDLLRRFGSFLYNLEVSLLFGTWMTDVNGTPKIFPRRFGELLVLQRNDDLIDLEFCIVCMKKGYPIEQIWIDSTKRHGGRSTTSLRSALRLYRGAWTMRRGG